MGHVPCQIFTSAAESQFWRTLTIMIKISNCLKPYHLFEDMSHILLLLKNLDLPLGPIKDAKMLFELSIVHLGHAMQDFNTCIVDSLLFWATLTVMINISHYFEPCHLFEDMSHIRC
jgi:hypothetical protein